MTTQTETLLADLKSTLAASTQGKWQKGATTHHTINETGCKIAEFHHASDAQFCDIAHGLMPEIIRMLEAQPKRIAEIEAQQKPLTDAEIEKIFTDCVENHDSHPGWFARAIEAAHGVKP